MKNNKSKTASIYLNDAMISITSKKKTFQKRLLSKLSKELAKIPDDGKVIFRAALATMVVKKTNH